MASRGARQAAAALCAAARPNSRFRRLYWLAAGVAVTGVAAVTLKPAREGSLPPPWKAYFVAHADAAPRDPVSTASTFRDDPETSMRFPISLPLVTTAPPLTLVGLGVRKVSFLRVKVYSAGFYLDDATLQHLDDIPGWHTYTAQHLLTPPTSPSPDPLGAPQLSGEALIGQLLEQPIACAVRIVPVRNTDFGHLRDGFTRAILARQKAAQKTGKLTEVDEQCIATSLQELKALFPAQTVPKGKSLVLLRASSGALIVEYEGKVLGSVNDSWMSRELMLAYFADRDVISPKLKEDVAQGLEAFIKH